MCHRENWTNKIFSTLALPENRIKQSKKINKKK